MRRRAAAGLLTGSLVLLAPGVARADAVDDAVSSLRTHRVFVASDAEAASFVDGAKLAELIGTADIRIAVLPDAVRGTSTSAQTVQRLQAELGDQRDVVIGVVGRKLSVQAGSRAPVDQSDSATIVSDAYGRHSVGGFTKDNVEGALEDIVRDVEAAASRSGRSSGSSAGSGGGHGAAVAGFLAVLAIGAGTGGLWFGLRRRAGRRRAEELFAARADVESLPGGWYATPLWEQLLITEAGLGEWDHGGYDQEDQQGHDTAAAAAAAGWGGGDWGSGVDTGWRGGDWGSGAGSSWGGTGSDVGSDVGSDSASTGWGGGDWGGGSR